MYFSFLVFLDNMDRELGNLLMMHLNVIIVVHYAFSFVICIGIFEILGFGDTTSRGSWLEIVLKDMFLLVVELGVMYTVLKEKLH